MRNRRGWLLAMNVSLGVAVVALALPAAGFQSARAHGKYTMVGGQTRGNDSKAIYIVDSANEEMIALRWNDSRGQLDWIDYRDIAADAERRQGR